MALRITVKGASKLPNVEVMGKSDPYAAVTFRGRTLQTKYIDNCLEPQWNETVEFSLKQQPLTTGDLLCVQVFDYELIGHDRLLGKTQVPLKRVAQKGKLESDFSLIATDGSATKSVISLSLSYEASEVVSDEGHMDKQGVGLTVVGETQSATPTTRSLETGIDHTRSSASSLPDRPLNFHLRFHIIEARKLLGENLKPTVKVVIGEEAKSTRVAMGTQNPIWNETLVFSGRDRPQEFLSRMVDIRVYNSKMIFRNSLIGSFNFDVGLVYDEPGHAIIHKWLLLTDPDDVTSEAKGYLKVSVNVLPPGVVAKHSPLTLDDDAVDTENNLWEPVQGAKRQLATLSVCIFRAEDIPQMDPPAALGLGSMFAHDSEDQEQKLADPYATVSAFGHRCRTETIQNSRYPVWNERLNFPLKFPALSDHIKMQLKDDDFMRSDDFIGTIELSLAQISVPGKNGFLPTFGPVFVTMYGSPREFSVLPAASRADMDKGKTEGVAYRGRVLVAMETTLGVLPTVTKESVNNPKDLQSLQSCLQRKKYVLYAIFLHAGMISPMDQPVEFEVSIGNYGNMLDEHVLGSTSRTPSSNPVYDGNHYYYLPWFDSKPCMQVESHWEDNTYRIGSLNILRSICQQLEAGLSKCRAIMADKTYDLEELKTEAAKMLGNLITHLETPLPALPTEGVPSNNVNKLDVALRKWRIQEMEAILNDAKQLQSAVISSQVLQEVEVMYQRLTKLATEPQLSIPDVVIAMISGGKHVAFFRIPAHRLMYLPKQGTANSSPSAQGDLFGKPQTVLLKPPCAVREIAHEGGEECCAIIEVVLGLGLASQLQEEPPWSEFLQIPDGQEVIFAEVYENQAWLASWGTRGLSKPNFSDIKGQVGLPIDGLPESSFPPPEGWRWKEGWYIGNPPSSLATCHSSTAEQDIPVVVLEYQSIPDGSSTSRAPNKTEWKDEHGNKLPIQSKEDLQPPDGMEWKSDWVVTREGAVDENGWEYTSTNDGGSTWMATAQRQCRHQRRKWTRVSVRKTDLGGSRESLSTVGELSMSLSGGEGWEYSRFPFVEYHTTKHLLDLVRRRRWLRRMVEDTASGTSSKHTASPLFRISTKNAGESGGSVSQDWAPLKLISFSKSACHTYQMRAYLYQARGLCSSDNSGLSTPYGIVSFIHKSGKTTIKEQTINPVWSQTVVLDDVIMYGPPEHVGTFMPPVWIEFFDRDTLGHDEYLGASVVPASVCLDGRTGAQPQLQWHPIKRWKENAGETLAAAILFLNEEGIKLPDVVFPEPKKEFDQIEMLCLGVRNIHKHLLFSVDSPLVELECGGHRTRMDMSIKSARDFPNFPKPLLTMDAQLAPGDSLYASPLNIRLLDERLFGWKPLVGVHSVSDVRMLHSGPQSGPRDLFSIARVLSFLTKKGTTASRYMLNQALGEGGKGGEDEEVVTVEMQADDFIQTEGRKDKDDEFDWWSKFYASLDNSPLSQVEYKQAGFDTLVVYPGPLEDQFDQFQDLLAIYPLSHGKGWQGDKENFVGNLKAALRVLPAAEAEGVGKDNSLFADLALAESVDCLVRVYIVRAIDLQPADRNGKADAYIRVKVGRKEISDKENYIPNELNPIFGKVYELPAHLPTSHTLKVIVMDYDLTSANDLIGETTVDLENRYLTQHRAMCGLPETFSAVGAVNEWRDSQQPVDLLADWAEMGGFEPPRWNGRTEVVVGGQLHRLVDFEPNGPPHKDVGPEDQRLALHVLRQQGLVPEHVETRPLFNPTRDAVQGQLQMWVDIFPNYLAPPPPPVVISPRQPKKYELRVIIYNTQDVWLDEISVVTGEAMSDIYIKGWLQGLDDTQKTDVHYRSLDGEGNFNWRLVFPFEYIPQEKVMVVKKKEHFYSLDTTERRLPPRLSLQIWDNDLISPDDVLGTLEVDLLSVPQHAKVPHHCSFKQLPEVNPKAETVSLFKHRRLRGWWPVLRHVGGGNSAYKLLAGKIEMEMEILTELEAKSRPAGRGRGEPNNHPFLPEPNRPATSFLWLTSPWKSFKFIIWKYYKCHIFAAIALVLIILLMAVWIYTIPSTFANWATSSLLQ